MFKKTLIAATLAALSTSAMAVDVTTGSTTTTYGSEALVSGVAKNDYTELLLGTPTPTSANIDLSTVKLTLGAEYSVGDTITISIAGGTFKQSETFALNSTEAVPGTTGMSVGFLSATDTTLLFRVTEVNGVTDGQTLVLDKGTYVPTTTTPAVGGTDATSNSIKLNSTAVGTKVTISALAQTSTGLTIDSSGTTDSFEIGSVIQEHKYVATTKLNADIDVADERKALAVSGAVALSDTATLTYTYDAAAQAKFVLDGSNDVTMTVNGSFTGFETGVTDATNLGKIAIAGTNATVAADLLSGKDLFNNPSSAGTVGFVFTPDDAAATRVVLNTSTYSVDAVLETAAAQKFTYANIALGELALNGASENFGYVPVGYDAVTTQFEIGNKGSVDGEITLTAFDTAGNNYSAVLPQKAEAGKLTKISDADITSAFVLAGGTKLKLTITVNSPASNISMSGYSNRGTTGRMAISATTN